MSEKRNCDIVQDLIPLEMDGVCTEGSKEFLQEHIGQCESCRRLYDMARKGTWRRAAPAKEETALALSMKAVGKKLHIRRILLIFLSIVVLMYGGIFAWNQLMRYETSIPVGSYSAYVYAETSGQAYVLAHMPYASSNVGATSVSYTLLTADDEENTTGEANAYIVELRPRYNVFAEKWNMRRYHSSTHLGGTMLEVKEGHLYTTSKYTNGFVSGVPIAEVRVCDGDAYQVIYSWGNEVLMFDGVVPEQGESAAEYNGVFPEIPKG